MSLVQLEDVCFAFGANRLINDISLHINPGSRIALSGANGSGKTTLLKIICGELKPDSGFLRVRNNTRISYLPQNGVVTSDRSLYDEIDSVFAAQRECVQKLQHTAEKLADGSLSEEKRKRLLQEYADLQAEIDAGGYYLRDKKIDRVLSGLGFGRDRYSLLCSDFSDGWQMRIALAKVLLRDAEVLLLDEPTNYLDLETREWLKNFLLQFGGGVIVVSHDRYFLDSIVDCVAELFKGNLRLYQGNYTAYEQERERNIRELLKRKKQQEGELEKAQRFIERFRSKATKASAVQSRIKMVEKTDEIVLPAALKKIHFRFPEAPHSGRKVLELHGVQKGYGGHPVLRDISLEVGRGEKIVFVGPNGVGKSTLLRILAGKEAPDAGEVRYGAGVKIGYFSHNDAVLYTSQRSVLQELEEDAPTQVLPRLRAMLGAFLFSDDDVHKKVSVLSGGERSRVLLLRLLVRACNLLICDEPTNHLDLTSKDILLDALQHFGGTLLFVSHDRYFIEALAQKTIEVKDHTLKIYNGDYEYYLAKREPPPENPDSTVESISQKKTESQNQRKALSRLKNRLRNLEIQADETMSRYEDLEQQQGELEHSLAREEVYADGEQMKRVKAELQQIEHEKASLLVQWQEIEDEVQEIRIKLY